MTTLLLGTLVLADRLLPGGAVVIEGDCQAWVGPAPELPPAWRDLPAHRAPYIAPGLIDEHIHGGFGLDVVGASPADLLQLACRLAASGTTAFLATAISAEPEPLRATARHLAAARAAQATARRAEPPATARREDAQPPPRVEAELLGLHLEGPFLNPQKAGAHALDRLRPLNPAEVAALQELAEGAIRLITVAPELASPDQLAALRSLGLRLSAGHSQATFTQAQAAFAAGVTQVTHLFNAMPPLGHREPGLPGAALTTPGVFAEVILDFIHVHPAAAQVAIESKGPSEMILITDALPVSRLAPGRHAWDGREVDVTAQAVYLPDGTLAGSNLTLLQAVRNARQLGFPLPQAVAMASLNPARALGLARKGRLGAGLDADLLLLSEDLGLAGVYCRGQEAPR